MADCGVCGKTGLVEGECSVLRLSPEEKTYIQATTGQPAPEKYTYCYPCHRILKNPLAGAELMKGTLAANLKQAGVAEADEIADRLFKFLIKRAAPEPLS